MSPSRPPRPDPPEPTPKRDYLGVYALVTGAVLMSAGLAVILFDVFTDGSDVRLWGFGVGLVMLGGAAALPGTFLPILSAVLKKIPGRGETIKPPESLTDIYLDDKEDDAEK